LLVDKRNKHICEMSILTLSWMDSVIVRRIWR